jgi:predicted nucleic acid-binding protein
VILLDTDVLLDVALDRAPHADDAARLLAHFEQRPRGAFVAWHTLANLYYLLRPARGRGDAREFVKDLVTFVTVAPTDTEAMRFAVALGLADMEDAMQVAAARACGALYIATRNVKDFRQSPIPARTPAQLLKEMADLKA